MTLEEYELVPRICGYLMGPPTCCVKTEWISRTGLSCHTGENSGRPGIDDTFQRGSRQCYQNMAGHDSGLPEGFSRWVGRNCRSVPISLICQQRHGGITIFGMATTRNEHPGWHLPTVWICGHSFQVTQYDMPTQCTTFRNIYGGQGPELHGGGRLLPCETPPNYSLPGMWIWSHRGVNDNALTTYAWDRTINLLDLAASQSDWTPTSGVQYELPVVN